MKLFRLPPGEWGIVRAVREERPGLRGRLEDLGLVEGTAVKCVQRSPLGDPTAYCIRGAVIAIRREDSSAVEVEISEESIVSEE